MMMRRLICGVVVLAGLVGCSGQTGPDSNTAVFKTAEEASAARRAKLTHDWKDLASKIANAERPDVQTRQAADAFALTLSADGVEQTIDLTPLSEKLTNANGREREPIRAYLAERLPEFDRARLKAIGFERAKPMLLPYLANMKETLARTPADASRAPIVNPVVIDLNWLPTVRWPGSAARTPVDAEVATSWKAPADQVSAAALENLRKSFAQEGEAVFRTTDLPAGLGRYGTLREGADPAIIVLPEFVAKVRKAWNSKDDLVIFFPSRNVINVIERKNERLLNEMIPQWSKRFGQLTEPMISTMILAGDGGLSLLSYTPPSAATKPATKPATKRAYIVN